ncbi:MAG: DNA-3-methyladenine glycosylase [Armatimonadota bacterium]
MRQDSPQPLPRSFYIREAPLVAQELLGCLLLRRLDGELVGGVIVETEAYLGEGDPGSHASRGPTQRTAPMWEIGGTAYVYRIYGIHYCLNFVTGLAGIAQAVLVRALEPTYGVDVLRARRGRADLRDLTSGPGKLCQALAVDLSLNRADLTHGDLFVAARPEPSLPIGPIIATTRIGLPQGQGDDVPLRFYLANSTCVSRRDRAAEQR